MLDSIRRYPLRTLVGQSPEESDVLQESREQLLNVLLIGASLVGGVAWAAVFVAALITDFGWVPVITGAVLVPLLAFSAYKSNWSFTARGLLLLTAVYLIGLQDLLTLGLLGDSHLALLMLPVLAIMIFGWRGGMASAALSIATVFTAERLIDQLPITQESIEFHLAGASWFDKTAFFALSAITIYFAMAQLLSKARLALENEKLLEQALILEAEELEERAKKQNQALKIGAEISRHITQFLQQEPLVEAIVQEVQNATHFEHVHLFLSNSADKLLVLSSSTSPTAQKFIEEGAAIAFGEGIVGETAARREAKLIADLEQISPEQNRLSFTAARSLIAAPICFGNSVMGVLAIQKNDADALTPDDLFLTETIASQVSVALQNARLFAQTQRQVSQTRLLNQIQKKVQAAQTIEEVLQIAAESLTDIFNASRTHIAVGTEEATKFSQNGRHNFL